MPILAVHIANREYYIKNGVTKEEWVEWLTSKVNKTSVTETNFEEYLGIILDFAEENPALFAESK